VTKYEHTQTGYWIIYATGLPALILLTMTAFSSATRLELFLAFVLLLCVLLFWRLTIKVDNETLGASFGIGLIRKAVPVANIVACEPIRTRWWWGWGIHLTPYGWLYNVSGWDAVAITLRDGKRFCVGTDEPQELQAAIRRFASLR
jgi:hypothetical protein